MLPLRQRVATQMTALQASLDQMLVDPAPPNNLPSSAPLGGDMDLLIEPTGTVRCVFGEQIDLGQLGRLSIRRGSHVEPRRMANGPPISRRSKARCWDRSPVEPRRSTLRSCFRNTGCGHRGNCLSH